jgi:hypothetical protein
MLLAGALLLPGALWADEQHKARAARPAAAATAGGGSQPGANLNQPGECDSRSGTAATNPACKSPKVNDAFGGGHGPGAARGNLPQGGTKDVPQAERKLPTGQTPAQRAATHKAAVPGVVGADGKLVHPGDFSREAELKTLADPRSAVGDGMKPLPGAGSTDPGFPGRLGGSEALGNVSTTVAPGAGKNESTRREQQSEVKGDFQRQGSTGIITLSGNRGEVAWQISKDGTLVRETIKVHDKDATTVLVKDYETKTTTITVTMKTGEVFRQVNDGELKRVKTPNPETDTGDGHGPKNLTGQGRPQKSPSEVEAERRRQVTQPSDDQRRQFERMKMEADVALKSAMAKRTDGRINPSREGTPGPGGFTGPIVDTRPRGVDGLPRTPSKGPGDFGQPVTQPRGGGTTPDNPVASGGPGQATTGSEPPRR